MRTIQFLWGVLPLAALMVVACNQNELPVDPSEDEAVYAAQASIYSSDSNFHSSDEGGTIYFDTKGGTIVIDVNCGGEWTVENHASDVFTTTIDASAGTLTVTAGANTVESDITGTITLVTYNQGIEFATITAVQDAYGAPELSVDLTEWNAPAKGQLSTAATVDCSLEDYEIEIEDDWLSYETNGTGFTLIASENATVEPRSTKVQVIATDGVRTKRHNISVSQDASAYITLGRNSLTISSFEETDLIHVSSNYDVEYSLEGTAGWLTVGFSDQTLTVEASENTTGEARSAVVTFTAGDGAENTATVSLPITQVNASALLLVYNITTANRNITLPLSGTVNCTVDWGDGSAVETVTSTLPSHKFTDIGEYSVIVDGTVTALRSDSFATESNPNYELTAVKQWGSTGFTYMYRALYYHMGLQTLPEKAGDAFENITSAYGMFYGCESLENVSEDMFAKSTKNTSLAYLFYGCSSLGSVPDGIFDACTEATTARGVFDNCSSLASIPDGLFSKNTKLTDLAYCFYGCTSLKEVPSDLFANCREVTTFYASFYNCGLVVAPAGLFKDLDKVTTFEFVFSHNSYLTTFESELFAGCSSVTTFKNAFQTATKLTTIAGDIFKGCTAVEDFTWAFYNANLSEIPSGLLDDLVNVTDMSYGFGSNGGLKKVPAGLFDNCTKVTTLECIFQYCPLETIPAGLFDKNILNTSFSGAFNLCTSLKEIPEDLFKYNTEVEDFSYAFYSTAITEIPDNLFGSCPKAKDFTATFYECDNLKELPAGLFANCYGAQEFLLCFRGCDGLTTPLPAGLFDDCKNTEDFQSVFYMCGNLTGETPYTVINGEKVHLYDRTEELGFVVPEGLGCYRYCYKLDDYYTMPSRWGDPSNESSLNAFPTEISAPVPVPAVCENCSSDSEEYVNF